MITLTKQWNYHYPIKEIVSVVVVDWNVNTLRIQERSRVSELFVLIFKGT